MLTLYEALSAEPVALIAAIGRRHGLGLDSNLKKTAVLEKVAGHLRSAAAWPQLLPQLRRAEKDALDRLLATGGHGAAAPLLRLYGPLRAPRPLLQALRAGAELSPLEGLRLAGILFKDRDRWPAELFIPADLLPHLPEPTQLAGPRSTSAPVSRPPVQLALHDLALLLALVWQQQPVLLHGRWLPPSFLTAWASYCQGRVEQPQARSELQTGRRRFLHYLAENAGFLNAELRMMNDASKTYPSPISNLQSPISILPAAWLWLKAGYAVQLQTIWQAWRQPDPERWQRFQLPGSDWLPNPAPLLEILWPALLQLDATDPDRFAENLVKHQPALLNLIPAGRIDPLATLHQTISRLLRGPLRWLGLLEPDSGQLTAQGRAWLSQDQAAPAVDPPPGAPFYLTLQPPADNPLATTVLITPGDGLAGPDQLVTLLSLSEPTPAPPAPHRLTSASVVQALHQGWSLAEIRAGLERLSGQPLPGRFQDLLKAWSELAFQITIRPVTLLETGNPAIISRLAGQRRGRDHIIGTLSPRAVEVDAARLPQLISRLVEQEGVPPRVIGPGRPPAAGMDPGPARPATARPITPAEAAYLWQTVRVYQELGRWLDRPSHIPSLLVDKLAELTTPGALASAEAAVGQALADLQNVIDGRQIFPPWLDEGQPVEDSLAVIEAALANGQTLQMSYYTAGREELTHRQVEPYRLEYRGDTPYLVGFCRRTQAERVFRLDRIQAIEPVP